MRIKPLLSNRLYAWRRPCMVEVSMFWSQLDPSLVRKIGSNPWVRRKRNCTSAAETLQPSVGKWQEAQDRPLVPSDWKNAPVKFIGALLTLYVSSNPLRFGRGNRLGSDWPLAAVVIMATAIRREIFLSSIYSTSLNRTVFSY